MTSCHLACFQSVELTWSAHPDQNFHTVFGHGGNKCLRSFVQRPHHGNRRCDIGFSARPQAQAFHAWVGKDYGTLRSKA